MCEGRVNEQGVPLPEVFSAVVRSEEGSSVEVRGSSSVATIFIEDSPECSTSILSSNNYNIPGVG